jgi:hypothetical protein
MKLKHLVAASIATALVLTPFAAFASDSTTTTSSTVVISPTVNPTPTETSTATSTPSIHPLPPVAEDHSNHVDPALMKALIDAGNYLTAGLRAGDVAPQGSQSTLPTSASAGTAPQSDLVKDILWVKHGNGILLCVDGTLDGTKFFSYIAGSKDSSSGKVSSGIKPEKCNPKYFTETPHPSETPHNSKGGSTSGEHSKVADPSLSAALYAGVKYIISGIKAGDIAPTTGAVFAHELPVATTVGAAPQSSLIKDVVYYSNPTKKSGAACVDGTVDGVVFFKLMAGLDMKENVSANLGKCPTSNSTQETHQSPKPSESPKPAEQHNPPTTPGSHQGGSENNLKQGLMINANYLAKLIKSGSAPASGVKSSTEANAIIKDRVWTTSVNSDGNKSGVICIDGALDGSTYYKYTLEDLNNPTSGKYSQGKCDLSVAVPVTAPTVTVTP